MLDIKYIREHVDDIKTNNRNRGVEVDVDRLIELDERRRDLMKQSETIRAEQKRTEDRKQAGALKEQFKQLESQLVVCAGEYQSLLEKIPNLTHPEVPVGGEDDFNVLTTAGKPPKFDFEPKDHEELLVKLGMLDFERGAKVAGTKFYFVQGELVRLNQALINYGIDVVTKHGYQLMETPDVARDAILRGIGFNPRGPETQVYSLEGTDLSLIGTAEITMGGYHADEIIDLSAGPQKYVALSHCFRTEAGAAGRVSKGLYRVHQFTKLEMFVYCMPEDSERLHQEMLDIEREIADGLGLPYRVIDVASGDLGGPAYRKYDIEAWMVMKGPSGDRAGGYGEITSTSNCTDYQARRLNIRYRADDGANVFVHTLNGTALNTSRFPIAIVENFQTAEGSFTIPDVLRR